MNFDDLKAFVMLYQLRSFSTAAVALHLSQSALSKRIQRLEKLVGTQLIDTSNHRHLLITEAGERFFFHAGKILHQTDLMQADLNSLTSLSDGVLTIGAVPILGQYGISKIIIDFAASFPKLSLHVHEQEGGDLINQLLTGDLDLALLRDTQTVLLSDHEFTKLTLVQDHLQVILAAANPLALQAALTPQQLATSTVVSLLRGSGVYEPMQSFFLTAGIEPRVIFTSPHIETLLSMVAGSDNITFLFHTSYQPFAKAAFVARPLIPEITSHLQLVYRTHKASPAVVTFTAYLSKQFTQNPSH